MTATAVGTQHRTVDRAGLVAMGVLTAWFFAISWLRYRHAWAGFDLAIFDQAAWQIAHGRGHMSLIERHVMADHFSPVLYMFGMLYRLAPTPAWLLGAQALALGATVLPMRGVARHLEQPPRRATVLVALSAPLLAAGVFDFHPSTLAVPFFAWALLFALEERPTLTAVAAMGAVLCRADFALVVLAIGIVAAPRSRLRLVAVGTLAAAVSAVGPGQFGETNGWVVQFGHLGASPTQALLHPWTVVGELLSAESLAILGFWVIAAGVAIVLQPRWLLALTVAGLPILLSRWEGTALPWNHYGAPMAPIAIGGTLAGLTFIAGRDDRWSKRFDVAWWSGPVLILLAASPISPFIPDYNRVWGFAFGGDGLDVAGAAAFVKPDDAVSASERVLPRVSQREHAYLFPVPYAVPDGFFAEGSEPSLTRYGPDAVDVVIAPDIPEDLVASGEFEVVGEVEGLVILRRLGGESE